MFPNLNTAAIGVNASFEETVELAARHGFAGIDFSVVEAQNRMKESGVDSIYELLEASGVRLGTFGLPVNWRGDEATFQEGLHALADQAEAARKLCCYRTTTWIMPASDTMEFDENYRFHVERLRPIAEVLADHEIRLGLEFVGPKTLRQSKRHEFIYDMEGMLQLIRDIGTDNVGLLVDLYHVHTSHGDLSAIGKLRNEDVIAVHVNDAAAGVPTDELLDNARALPCETGVTDIGGFLRTLAAIGYNGPVTTEPFSQRVRELTKEEAVRQTAEAMRRAWQIAGLSW